MMRQKIIILDAGCFWGVEEKLGLLEGVVETVVGYAGGSTVNPTYKGVCSGTTGHAEVVRVVYDNALISSRKILEFFYAMHDPSQVNQQGPDVGSQYRSVIFYGDQEQSDIAHDLQVSGEQENGTVYATQILPMTNFYRAEDYHQKYLLNQQRVL